MNKGQKWLLFVAASLYFMVGFAFVSRSVESIFQIIGFTIIAGITVSIFYVILGVPTIPNFRYRAKEKIIRRRILVVSYKPAVTFWDRVYQKIVRKLFVVMNVEFESARTKDELYEQALDIVGKYEQVSTSLLQRRLSIGYARASRLLDQLHEEGIVSEGRGGELRTVLIKKSKDLKSKELPN